MIAMCINKATITTFKRITCKHKRQYLRFIKYLHGDSINQHDGKRFEYECTRCGMTVYMDHPIDCSGCKHLFYWNSGQIDCDKDAYKYTDFYWKPFCCWEEGEIT